MTTKIANILQCYALGMGIKQISRSFELSRNTVRRYVRLFQECGIPIKELAAMPSARIQEMFSEGVGRNREPSQRQLELEALLPEYAARLSRRGVTVKTLYEEYRETHPDGYRHASFGNYLMRYRMVTHVVGHVEHYAGDQMYIDFAGDKLEVVDSESGECRSVEVFVAILPCSHYTYCEAVWSQSRQDLIKACENALHFYGGVPMAIVPDNLKSAVTRSDRNEPVINEEFAAFAEHYGCTVYPTRVRHPKDKALVENAVKHNEISNRRPLTVSVIAEGDTVEVSNPLQPKRGGSAGMGIGLANLAKRYQLLYKKDIIVKEENHRFAVILPLI